MFRVHRLLSILLATLLALLIIGPIGALPAEAASKRPSISKVGSGSGPVTPTNVVISGKKLSGAKAVTFGGRSGTIVRRLGATGVVVRTPARMRAGTVSVQIRTEKGWSKASAKARYTFVAAPVITRVAPGAGKQAGGNQVTLSGRNLTTTNRVTFGSVKASIVRRASSSVVVRVPRAARPGSVAVWVRTAGGQSRVTTATRFTYVAPPVLAGLSPVSGPYTGGQRLTLTGSNFALATRVIIGTLDATILGRAANAVTVRTPIGVIGATGVRVITPGGTTGAKAYTYVEHAAANSATVDLVADTFRPTTVEWVTGGYDADSGVQRPWIVSLPRGETVPDVAAPFYLAPGSEVFPSGLAGTVDSVAVQADESARVTVTPTAVKRVFDKYSADFSGPIVDPDANGRAGVGRSVTFPLDASSLFCRNQQGQSVTFASALSMTVSDMDVTQHVDWGGLVSHPTLDATFTAEVTTTGEISVAAKSTCTTSAAWENAHRKVFPVGAHGMTVSIAPTYQFSVSAKGVLTLTDRTRTTFAVNAKFGETPRFSRTSRTVESTFGGALSFTAGVSGGIAVQFGELDRVGVRGKALLAVSATVTATENNVCISGKLVLKLSVGLFLDLFVERWESPTLSTEIPLREFARQCLRADSTPPPNGEPQIASARLADAELGMPYETTLETTDNRAGRWSIIRYALPAGLSLDPDTGRIVGTPTGAIGDYPVIIDFVDAAGRVATTTIRIRVQPPTGIGGGNLQITLRWVGPADLDLHVQDPAGEHINYSHKPLPAGVSSTRTPTPIAMANSTTTTPSKTSSGRRAARRAAPTWHGLRCSTPVGVRWTGS